MLVGFICKVARGWVAREMILIRLVSTRSLYLVFIGSNKIKPPKKLAFLGNVTESMHSTPKSDKVALLTMLPLPSKHVKASHYRPASEIPLVGRYWSEIANLASVAFSER